METHYQNREIDEKFRSVHERFDLQDTALSRILEQTTATNGKVKKIIIALVLVVGFIIGASGKELIPTLAKLLI